MGKVIVVLFSLENSSRSLNDALQNAWQSYRPGGLRMVMNAVVDSPYYDGGFLFPEDYGTQAPAMVFFKENEQGELVSVFYTTDESKMSRSSWIRDKVSEIYESPLPDQSSGSGGDAPDGGGGIVPGDGNDLFPGLADIFGGGLLTYAAIAAVAFYVLKKRD